MSLRDRIEAAKLAAPAAPKSQRPPNAYSLSGIFTKGDKENSTWAGRVIGLDGEKKLKLSFDDLYSEIEWTNEKGQTPRGRKTYFLEEGVYKAHVIAKKGENPTWEIFAIVDAKREDLTEEVATVIFLEEGVELPDESQIPE